MFLLVRLCYQTQTTCLRHIEVSIQDVTCDFLWFGSVCLKVRSFYCEFVSVFEHFVCLWTTTEDRWDTVFVFVTCVDSINLISLNRSVCVCVSFSCTCLIKNINYYNQQQRIQTTSPPGREKSWTNNIFRQQLSLWRRLTTPEEESTEIRHCWQWATSLPVWEDTPLK